MAGPNFVLDKGYAAGGAIRQFRCVELSGSEVVTECNAADDQVWGVCQEEVSAGDATNGRVVDVRLMGASRCIAGINFAIGARLGTDNQGRVVPVVVTVGAFHNQVGVAMQAAAAAGDHVDVLLTPGVTINGAVS
jgi:hypothetical protein